MGMLVLDQRQQGSLTAFNLINTATKRDEHIYSVLLGLFPANSLVHTQPAIKMN